jgi:aminotransferase
MKRPVSQRAERFTESVIREMTRLAQRHGAVNLAQGFPDFPAPDEVKHAAAEAIAADVNQYAITWGSRPLREAIARRLERHIGIACDPETEITVCCGATEAMIATLLAVADPGDEVVILEPFYENYGPDCILSGAVPRFVQLRPPAWSFDKDELARAFSDRTKAIVLNTPHNPTGHVFTHDELGFIADLCRRHDALALTDEIYEYILYDGRRHVSLATLPGMRERTVTISGMSKTFSVTGWRVGWAVAPPRITAAIRKVHDFLTVGAPAPLQQAGAVALSLPDSFFDGLRVAYQRRRDLLVPILELTGFALTRPEGAYYVMTDLGRSGFFDDVAFARHLVTEVGVAVVPGSSFYSDPARGARQVRFCFPKRDETLRAAGERLETRLRPR